MGTLCPPPYLFTLCKWLWACFTQIVKELLSASLLA